MENIERNGEEMPIQEISLKKLDIGEKDKAKRIKFLESTDNFFKLAGSNSNYLMNKNFTRIFKEKPDGKFRVMRNDENFAELKNYSDIILFLKHKTIKEKEIKKALNEIYIFKRFTGIWKGEIKEPNQLILSHANIVSKKNENIIELALFDEKEFKFHLFKINMKEILDFWSNFY